MVLDGVSGGSGGGQGIVPFLPLNELGLPRPAIAGAPVTSGAAVSGAAVTTGGTN
jgi:hypothetical protein